MLLCRIVVHARQRRGNGRCGVGEMLDKVVDFVRQGQLLSGEGYENFFELGRRG